MPYLQAYQYSSFTKYDKLNNPFTEYYFWVEDNAIIQPTSTRTLSAKAAEQQLDEIPISYMVNQKLESEERITIEGINYTLPVRFTQAIIRGLRGLINADRRFTVRFTRDFTLRDDLDKGATDLQLKNHHEEWKIFREHQQFHLDRYLWDKITESIVGYRLDDPSIRVPSLNRELYDARFLTSTQIGLRSGQTFTDGQLALQTVLADLENPDNDFKPVDINTFFELHNFDDDEAIIESMNTIYNTFAFEHVNRIYFSVLFDAFSLKDKYEDIFKTSMVALHGIRPFQVAGVFDD